MRILNAAVAFSIVCLSLYCKPPQQAKQGKVNNVNAITIKVLTYNIHHANPPSKPGVIDLDVIAAAIIKQAPDLVALQEVDVYTKRSGSNLNEAEELGRKTKMYSWFAKAINYDGGEYGVAVLSRYPILSTQRYELPTLTGTNGEPRILATAIIQLPNNRKMLFACTHLDAQRSDTNRVLQAKKIASVLKKEILPIIIAGDFNSEPSGGVIAILDSLFTRTCIYNCSYTFPQINPTKTIDFIAVKPAENFIIKEHKVIDEKYASDHLPVFSIVTLK